MLDEPEKSRVLVRGAVRLYDDRLPGPISKDLGDRIVQRLDRIEADPGQLDGALLSSSLILKYLVASNLGDAITAASLRSEIAGLLGEGPQEAPGDRPPPQVENHRRYRRRRDRVENLRD